MNNITPSKVSFRVAILISICSAIVLSAYHSFIESLHRYVFIVLPISIFVISYLIVRSATNDFIYKKIKLIYKSIYDLKSPKGTTYGKKSINDNALNDVEEEVDIWARTKRKEIEELKKMELYRKEFLGNVSHEMKTPIFNIHGYLDSLIDGGLNDKSINKKYLKKASKNVQRLSAIIEDLEFISQIENDRLDLNLEAFSINDLIKEVVASLEIQTQEANIKIDYKDGFDINHKVLADRERISHALINLVINSIKYGINGGEIFMSCYDMDKNILIEISDNGIGISKEHIPRLFERFYRVDTNRSRDKGGTGLGLSIVKHILDMHDQTINVRSTVDIGSTFGFTLRKV